MNQPHHDPALARSSDDASARREAQKQWNANPCGALPTTSYDAAYFSDVEADRYRQQYWQRKYFDYRTFAGGRVLEIGVGLGTDLKQFARSGAECFGVDITDTHLDLARTNLAGEGFEADLRKADATSLPFPDDYFDCVYSFGVLHHIPDAGRVLAEIRRVLKPGGALQLSVYHLYSIHTLHLFAHAFATGRLFRLGIDGVLATIEKGADGDAIKPYVKLYSRRAMHRLVMDAGFSEIRTGIRQIYFERHRILNYLRPLESVLGWYVCCRSRKPRE